MNNLPLAVLYTTGPVALRTAARVVENLLPSRLSRGANKGIGLEVCKQLTTNGIFTVLIARDIGRGYQAVDMLRTLGLRDVIFHQLDVLDPSRITALVDFLTEEFGRVDILVNNAGSLGGKRVAQLNKAVTEEDVTGLNAKAQREIF